MSVLLLQLRIRARKQTIEEYQIRQAELYPFTQIARSSYIYISLV